MVLEILTPEKKIFSGEAELVQLPGSEGSFEILKNHAPLISSLQEGKIKIKQKSADSFVEIKSGFVEVLNNRVTILAEGAE